MSATQPRSPAGSPTGGQYAAVDRPEADITLEGSTSRTTDTGHDTLVPSTGDIEDAWVGRYDGEHTSASHAETQAYRAQFRAWREREEARVRREVVAELTRHEGTEQEAARLLFDHDHLDNTEAWRNMAWADMGGSEPALERSSYETAASWLARRGLLATPALLAATAEERGGDLRPVTHEDLQAMHDDGTLVAWAEDLKGRFDGFVADNLEQIRASDAQMAAIDVRDFLLRTIEDEPFRPGGPGSTGDERYPYYLNAALAAISGRGVKALIGD